MKWSLVFLALLLGTGVFAAPLRVGKVIVRPLDVYSEDEANRGALFGFADRLHLETRASVIRKFLLFHEGEPFRPERLAETERNLRGQRFLKSASVVAQPPHDGVVDVIVTTQDSWSIAPETQAGNKGGASQVGASIVETNLFGSGKAMALRWDKTVDRTRFLIDYQDPTVNSSYWKARVTYGMNSDGYEHAFSLGRPFYAFAAPWSADFDFDSLRQDDRLYVAGQTTDQFRHDSSRIVASFGRAFDPNDARANRLVSGLRVARDDFAEESGATLPASRNFRYAFVRYEHAVNDFVKLNFINKDLRYEDFNLGGSYSIETALSPRVFGTSSNTFFARACAADGTRLGATSFIMPSFSIESRFDGGAANSVANATVNYVKRFDTGHPTATVARVTVTDGWRLDQDLQFFADGLTGLRAYRLHAFTGSRSFIANVEQRIYLGREVAQLVSPGVVAFFDTGNATYGGASKLLAVKSDVGVGIRIGLPRSPKNLIRIDVAYPLNTELGRRRGLLVSFASGQAF
ncbi:MAG TPA: BamA/TamA family outer membrane protein [Thermoanaerobaculia bacterium]